MLKDVKKHCIIFCAVLLALTGCLQWAMAAEKVKISYGVWGSTAELQRFQELAQLFNSTHPNIEVEIVLVAPGSGDYITKLFVLLVSGVAPDTFHLGASQLVELARSNTIQNLIPYLEKDPQLKVDSFYPPVISLSRYQGGLFGLPPDANPVVLFTNNDMFADAGVATPIEQDRTGKWNWDALRQTARKLSRYTGDNTTNAIGFHVRHYAGLIYPFIWAGGGDLWSDDATSVRITEPASILGLDFLASLIHEDRSGASTLPGNNVVNLFNQKRLGMTPDNRSKLPSFKTTMTVDWDVAPMPTGPAGRAGVLLTAFSAMNSNSAHKQEAWEWLRFFVGPVGQRFRLGENGNAVPTIRGLEDTVIGTGSKPVNARVFLEAYAYARPSPLAECLYPELSTLAMNGFQQIWNGTKSPRMVAEEIKQQAEAVIAKGVPRR